MDNTSPDLIKQLQFVFYRRKGYIFIPFIVFVPLAVTIGVFIPKIYRSSTTILVEPQKISADYVKPTVTTDIKDRLRTITQQMRSPSRLRKVLVNLNLVRDEFERITVNRMIGKMQKNIKINVKGKESFNITFTGSDPTIVMKITNQIASLFIEESLKISEQKAQSTTEFLSGELYNVEKQLQKQEERVRLFKQKYMGELPDQLETNLRALDRIQLQLQTTSGLLKGAQDQAILLKQQISAEKNIISIGNQSGAVTQDPLAQLQAVRVRLATVQSRYGEDWPEIKRLRSEIAGLEEQLKKTPGKEEDTDRIYSSPILNTLKINLKSVERRITHFKNAEISLISEIDDYKKKVANVPKREEELISLSRDYNILRNTYQSLLDKKLDAKLSESLEKKQKGENFIILDPAEISLTPHFPQFSQIILASFGGGIAISFLLVYIGEMANRSYQDLDNIEENLGFPVIGVIPRIRTTLWRRKQFLRLVRTISLIVVYLGVMGWIVLNRQSVQRQLWDWGILQQTRLI